MPTAGKKQGKNIYNKIGSIFELWTLGDCVKCGIFENTKYEKKYVMIKTDPEYTFEKYNRRVYGQFSKIKYPFTPYADDEIYGAFNSEWKLVFAK